MYDLYKPYMKLYDINNLDILENKENNNHLVKPIIKWVGGKTQIIKNIFELFPKIINNYYEPFLGGGSILIYLLNEIKNNNIYLLGDIYAYDINKYLIYMYKNIQEKCDEVYKNIIKISAEYNISHRETYYYNIREKYNKMNERDKLSPYGSAIFIFLNKMGFRGIYRVGCNGFNVPYGHYKNNFTIDKNHIYDLSELIKNVKFKCEPFDISFNEILELNKTRLINLDYIYIDPPYYPEKSTSFVGYDNLGFTQNEHDKLFKKIKLIPFKFMMSNSAMNYVIQKFMDNKYNIKKIICRRAINSKKPESTTLEVLITNY
jgi:DNA adenine methylase